MRRASTILLGVNVASMIVLTLYMRRISDRQKYISDTIASGIILDPAAYELTIR